MKHEAIYTTHADGNALVTLVGRDTPADDWTHVRTLASVPEDFTEELRDVERRLGSRLQLRKIEALKTHYCDCCMNGPGCACGVMLPSH